MNKELINGVFDAVVEFIGACANDVVAPEAEEEYTIFEGSLKADKDGNVNLYSKSGDLVSRTPVRKILSNFKNLGHTVIDLVDADDKERAEKAEAEAKERAKKAEEEAQAEAEADEAANKEIDNEIDSLESRISSLKLRKKPTRRFVKKLSFD